MKTTGLVIVICFLFSVWTYTQVQNVNISGSYNGVFMLSGVSSEYKVNGSPYLSEDWMFGTLKMRNEIAMEEIKGLFRYNLYGQEFEMIYDKDTFAIITPFSIESITISNKKFVPGFYVRRGKINEHLGSAYFEVLNEGLCRLMVRHEVKIKSGGGPAHYSWAGNDADAFVKYQQLYYQKSNGTEVIQLKKRKSHLRKVFADKYDDVIRYIRSEKINLRNNNELIMAFNYYNTLES